MKKARLGLIGWIGAIALSLGGFIAGSLAWFDTTVRVPEGKVSGSIIGAYFAYGDGSAENPYGIRDSRHVYNLAWLQYLGYFNRTIKGNTEGDKALIDQQYYFEIATDVDGTINMAGEYQYIPPIGTEQYPFLGHFNGNGKIITGAQITSDNTELQKHRIPSVLTGYGGEGVQTNPTPRVIGFFGVVGEYGNCPGIPSSQVAEVSNFGLTDCTVTVATSKTLVGMLAGYVNGNVSNVAVDSSTIDIKNSGVAAIDSDKITKNLSDYSIVGYSTDTKGIKKITQNIYDVNIKTKQFNANDDGNSQGWGGSINMVKLWQRLDNLYYSSNFKFASTISSYYSKKVFDQLDTNDPILDSEESYTNEDMLALEGAAQSSHKYIGNYVLYDLGYNYQYKYLVGGHYEEKNVYKSYSHTGYKITDGTHYLTLGFNGNNPVVQDSTDGENATLWSIPSSSGNITTEWNGDTYYLSGYGDEIGIYSSNESSSYKTVWSITKSDSKLVIADPDNYKIARDSEGWGLFSQSVEEYYLISFIYYGNTYYLVGKKDDSVTTTRTAEQATHWYKTEDNNYYCVLDSQKYYLSFYCEYEDYGYGYSGYYRKIAGQPIFCSSPNSEFVTLYNYDSSTRFFTAPNAPYVSNNYRLIETDPAYAYFNGAYPAESHNQRYRTQFTVAFYRYNPDEYNLNHLPANPLTRNGADYHFDETKTQNTYPSSETCYIPLNVKTDGAVNKNRTAVQTAIFTNGNYDPTSGNTGYIIAGNDWKNNYGLEDQYDRRNASTIRVSRYAISGNIDESYSSSDTGLNASKILTVDTQGKIKTINQIGTKNLTRYADSSQSFYDNALKGQSDVYGLHFMDSAISKEAVVDAQYVSILNKNYNVYQMPVNSIDFNLKQRGWINFFAGNYFTGNDSFFSLHEIVRDQNNKIQDIYEISEVYIDAYNKHSVIYKYKTSDGDKYLKPYWMDGNGDKYVLGADGSESNAAYGNLQYVGYEQIKNYLSDNKGAYSLKFKTSQIGVNSAFSSGGSNKKRLFYFEIPMNQGEYCLGSVDGGTGGYLLYLDIGANAAKTQRTIISEYYEIMDELFTYPVGVGFVAYVPTPKLAEGESSASSSQDSSTEGQKKTQQGQIVDPVDSACAAIAPSYQGTLNITRGNDNSVTVTSATGQSVTPKYLGDDLTWNLAAPTGNPKNTVKTKRLTYYDWNVNMVELRKTSFIETSTNGGAYTRESPFHQYIVTFDQQGNPTETEVASDKVKVYKTSNGFKYESATAIAALPIDGGNNGLGYSHALTDATKLVKIHYDELDGVGSEETVTLYIQPDSALAGTGQYYTYRKYVLGITVTGGNIKVKVDELGNKDIYVNSTKLTSAPSTVPVSAA